MWFGQTIRGRGNQQTEYFMSRLQRYIVCLRYCSGSEGCFNHPISIREHKQIQTELQGAGWGGRFTSAVSSHKFIFRVSDSSCPQTITLKWLCAFFPLNVSHLSEYNVTAGTVLQALDVWAMGVTLYCFAFGKVNVTTSAPQVLV